MSGAMGEFRVVKGRITRDEGEYRTDDLKSQICGKGVLFRFRDAGKLGKRISGIENVNRVCTELSIDAIRFVMKVLGMEGYEIDFYLDCPPGGARPCHWECVGLVYRSVE